MAILTHGSDLALAPTIRPIVRQTGRDVADAVARLSQLGFQRVQLDAALPGIRPRDLDQRARKDLVALLTRRSMQLAGLDLFIPRDHFRDPAQLDRAVSAVLAAIELCADLGRVPLSVPMPVKQIDDEVREHLVEAADGRSVALAIHAEDQRAQLQAWCTQAGHPSLGAAIDPAALLARGDDPCAVVAEFGKHLTVARLSDLTGGPTDSDDAGVMGTRCVVGEGDLDVMSYRIAVDLASGRRGPVVLDLRNMENALAAAAAAKTAWERTAIEM